MKRPRQKLHIHTTDRNIHSSPPPERGKIPFLLVAIVCLFMLAKAIPGWFPKTEHFKAVTVPIERVVEQPAPVAVLPPPEPVVIPPEQKEVYGPPAPEKIPAWKKNAVPAILEPGKYYVAIVIDDMGVNIPKSREMLDMPPGLTLSFLPYAQLVSEMAGQGRAKGHELMVHIPMEPLDATINAGENVLRTSMTRDELVTAIDINLSKFSGYVGINNHMGSKFTQDSAALAELMQVLKERELLMLDSKTIATSQGYEIASGMGVPAISRDVFLDDDPKLPAVREQLRVLEHVASKQGYAVAIGHPKEDTLQALKEWIPAAAGKNIQIVPISALVMALETGNVAQAHPLPPGPQPEPSIQSP